MFPRHLFAFAPLLCAGASGCGAVQTVRTAFEMPTPAPPTQRASETEFDSLGKALRGLDSKKFNTALSRWKATPPELNSIQAPRLVPKSGDSPARALARDLKQGVPLPQAPRSLRVTLSPVSPIKQALPPGILQPPTQSVASRTLRTSRLPLAAPDDAGRLAFLRAWAARQSLSRADDERLGRRALEDEVALASRGARAAVDLSLVSPEIQLELSNLRLQLLPLLAVPRERRVAAQQQIAAIEARLQRLWASETARQAELVRQSLVDVPAKLRREGEAALELQTRQTTQAQSARLQLLKSEKSQTSSPAPAPLRLVQPGAPAPDGARVGQSLRLAPMRQGQGKMEFPPRLNTDENIARGSIAPSSGRAERVARRSEQIWRAATK